LQTPRHSKLTQNHRFFWVGEFAIASVFAFASDRIISLVRADQERLAVV